MSSRRQMLEKFAVIGAKAPPVLTRAMASALKGSGLPLKAEELAGLSMMLSVMGALVGLMSAGLSAGGLMITVVLAGLGAAGPVFACKASGGFREAQVARQLEAAGLDVAQAVHDGKPLQAVLATLAEKSEAPLSEELCIVLAEHRLGLPFPEALERLAIRVRTAETVQIVGVLKEHLATGSDPLDPYRLLNFQQPFEMPSVPWPAAPQSFEEVVHRLMLDVFDALEPRQIYERRPAGATAQFLKERARERFPKMKLPDALKSQQERIVQAVADEAEGRGPLEELLRHPGVVAVYAVSPADVFAATPPSELIDPAPSVSGVPTPEGYQRTRVRFRDVEHMRRTASRLLAPLAQDLTPATPAVEGTLPDGWAVGAQIMEGGGAAILMQRSQ